MDKCFNKRRVKRYDYPLLAFATKFNRIGCLAAERIIKDFTSLA
jgi:hypothetical protein